MNHLIKRGDFWFGLWVGEIGRPNFSIHKTLLFATLTNMNTGISSEEACRTHLLTAEDFARMCNPDGSLKSQQSTTTFTLKDDPSKSLTINNTVLYISAALVLVIVCVVALLVRRRHKRA